MNSFYEYHLASRRKTLTQRCLVTCLAVSWSVGCGHADGLESKAESAPGETGLISLALRTQGDMTFETFSYIITGAQFAKSAPIDVANSNSVSATIGGIPVGDYTIVLAGNSQSPKANCSGSAAFSVSAGKLTNVPVGIACRLEQAPGTGAGGNAGTGGGDGGTTPVPIPPLVPALLGSLLLAIGARRVHSRS